MKKITTFWNYFQKNEQEILNAILLGINTDEVFSQLTKKLDYVSKRISFVIKAPLTINDKFLIIFTGGGYRKLFPKIIAFEEQAPTLKHFTAQAFIKPLQDATKYKNGTDEPCICKNYEIKISEIQIALLDYNIATKHIKINLYLPDYNELKHFEDLKSNIDWIVMQIVGEITFRIHIKKIKLNQMSLDDSGLLSLIELPDFIEYLYKINSRKKTRKI
ncbi:MULTISPECIES: hypothetical protein [unclassified Flavobacterium]|jgi:hypothetical protein|uniref:hypothetical protein n=2 Tax=Flavobacterium TaxID=237 RepID=UPI0025C31B35|nr:MULTISPECIES: hypothetical protein [unclassified Flavobacterium]